MMRGYPAVRKRLAAGCGNGRRDLETHYTALALTGHYCPLETYPCWFHLLPAL